MVIKENIVINNKNFIKHYSNENKLIRKVGTDEEYGEAIDLDYLNYQYEETDKPIEETDKPIEEEANIFI